jgi:hypothetical protein
MDFVLAALDLVPELACVRAGVLQIVAAAAGLDDPNKSQPGSFFTLGLDWTAISLSRSTFSGKLGRPAPTPVASTTTNVACQWWASARILPWSVPSLQVALGLDQRMVAALPTEVIG